jgi:hypothetical protein
MDSAHEWKQYYAAERSRLGETHLLRLLDAASPLPYARGGAVIVPHTRLEITGNQIASAVQTVVDSGADHVLALGVLHGARRADRQRVAAARAGDADAIDALRGVHDEDGLAAEEFSLDGFVALLDMAARRIGRSIDVTRRYPFLVGHEPMTLPGLAELREMVNEGAMLVVTTDPVHHGHAYDTPPDDCCDEHHPDTVVIASAAVEAQLELLRGHRFTEFEALAAQHRSDFRDTGPVMAALLGPGFRTRVHDLALVDYSVALQAPAPSWVAGALITAN